MIRLIEPTEAYPIRKLVLRNNQFLDEVPFEGDKDKNSFHLGYYSDGKLVGIVSYMNVTEKEIGDMVYQLRGMAVLEEFRNKGIATQLFDFGKEILRSRRAKIVWCNARESALAFYVHQGMEVVSVRFIIENIGPHFRMRMQL